MKRGTPLMLIAAFSLGGCVINFQAPAPVTPPLRPTEAASTNSVITRTDLSLIVLKGVKTRVRAIFALNPDCTEAGQVAVSVLTPPWHGKVVVERTEATPNYPPISERYHCNQQITPATLVFYQSDNEYFGNDSFAAQILYPNGSSRLVNYTISVH